MIDVWILHLMTICFVIVYFEMRVLSILKAMMAAPPNPEQIDKSWITESENVKIEDILSRIDNSKDMATLRVRVLRFLREYPELDIEDIASRVTESLLWRKQFDQNIGTESWKSARQMLNGEWACDYVQVGIYCGRAKDGSPVRIDRMGRYRPNEMEASRTTSKQDFQMFYMSMIEFIQNRLDRMSDEEHTLIQAYEIFDMKDIHLSQLNGTVLHFLSTLLTSYVRHYPHAVKKAIIINSPRWIHPFWMMTRNMMPAHFKDKVVMTYGDHEKIFVEELSQETLSWMSSKDVCDAGRSFVDD